MPRILYDPLFSLIPGQTAQIAAVGKTVWFPGGSDPPTPYYTASYCVDFIPPNATPEADPVSISMPVRPGFFYVPGAILDNSGHFSQGSLTLPAGCQHVHQLLSYSKFAVIRYPDTVQQTVDTLHAIMPAYVPMDIPYGIYTISGSSDQLLISRNTMDRCMFGWNSHLMDAVIVRNLSMEQIMDVHRRSENTVEINPHVILSQKACQYMATMATIPALTRYFERRRFGYLPIISNACLEYYGIRCGHCILVTELRVSQIRMPFEHLIRDARKKASICKSSPKEVSPVPSCDEIKVNNQKASSEDRSKVCISAQENISRNLLSGKATFCLNRNQGDGQNFWAQPNMPPPLFFDAQPISYSAQPQGNDGCCLPELDFDLIPTENDSLRICCERGYECFSFLVSTCNDLMRLGHLKSCEPLFGHFPSDYACGLANQRYVLIRAMWRSRAVYVFDTDLPNRYALLGVPMEFQMSSGELAAHLCSALYRVGGHWREDAGKALGGRFERLRHCHGSPFSEMNRWQRHLDKLIKP